MKDNQQGMTAAQYPGTHDHVWGYTAHYSEGLEVGYRWFNAHE